MTEQSQEFMQHTTEHTPAETTNSREREPSVIPGKYEHKDLLRAVESYDRHGGKVNAAVIRAVNYAAMRLNMRAVRKFGIPPEKLFYASRNPERSTACRKMADAIIAVLRGGE